MDRDTLNLLASQNIEVNIQSFVIGIILSVFLAFLVQQTYIKLSTTLSNKREFSKTFLVLAATTTIIITIVKSSLALSLGLVGALSIVRFRAAIKEPEELVYLFLLIGIGLGCGAGQFIIVSIGVIIILILIFIYSKINFKENLKSFNKLNLSIIYNFNTSEDDINKLKDLLVENTNFAKLISLSKTESETTINFQIQINDFEKFNKVINLIQNKDTKVFVSEDNILTT
ncbi:DUF4956 domain-containing protein [Candidatus Pelagibacter communis]|uniref:DUF4956 domain-containing protein n=1 Tax=Pelagibacter ubique TaxID=198252 RepID=UPI00094DADD8|nr:DUF4956 domain-containing protein [Candidatus Pelagibacter ubique]